MTELNKKEEETQKQDEEKTEKINDLTKNAKILENTITKLEKLIKRQKDGGEKI